MRKTDKLTEVYRTTNEMEALVVKGMLESYGIPCLMKSNAALSVHVFTIEGMGGVRIMVCDSEAEKARELIEGNNDV